MSLIFYDKPGFATRMLTYHAILRILLPHLLNIIPWYGVFCQ